jgi:hypothetical protein
MGYRFLTRLPTGRGAGVGMFAVTVVAGLVLGFAVGLLTSKRAGRWCPECGVTRVCPLCTSRAESVTRQGLSVSSAQPTSGRRA